jgi:hypothetical protein
MKRFMEDESEAGGDGCLRANGIGFNVLERQI